MLAHHPAPALRQINIYNTQDGPKTVHFQFTIVMSHNSIYVQIISDNNKKEWLKLPNI